jgi:predicted nucleotidyltransferase
MRIRLLVLHSRPYDSERSFTLPPRESLVHVYAGIPPEEIATFWRRNHIRKFSLFGSILTPRFRPESDIDILVEFELGKTPSLLDIAGMELELTEKMGRKVDLRTPQELSRYFRDEVVATAAVQYERP